LSAILEAIQEVYSKTVQNSMKHDTIRYEVRQVKITDKQDNKISK